MACNCGGAKKAGASTFTVTASDGTKSSYSTQVEAAAAAARLGGSYKKAGS